MWARAPQPWPAHERTALMAGYLRAVADWVVLPPEVDAPDARWRERVAAEPVEHDPAPSLMLAPCYVTPWASPRAR